MLFCCNKLHSRVPQLAWLCPVMARKAHLAQRLCLVDELVAAVVARARVPLAVLVGHDAADGVHHTGAREVLAGDQLQAL